MIDTELLKEKVLDLAMRGKLVEQDPTEGNARQLLEEIRLERERLIKEKKIKKNKPLPEITKAEIPYEIPESWEWVRLGDILYPQATATQKPQQFHYIDIASINNKKHEVESPSLIEAESAPSRANKYVESGDVLFSTVRPYLKNIAVVPNDNNDYIGTSGFYVLRGIKGIKNEFLFYLCLSNYMIQSMTRLMRGDNSPSVRNSDMDIFLVPLIPVKEQERIVNKIDEINQVLHSEH